MSPDRGGPKGERRDLSALSEWVDELAEAFVSLASDIVVVIGRDGVVQHVVQRPSDRLAPWADEWVGRPWGESVSTVTRGKVEQLLEEVRSSGQGRRREVNHVNRDGLDIPVSYAAVQLGDDGPVLAVGRDLRAIAAIQQRFMDAQRELESDYWRARQADARYRILFEAATDAVVIVDPTNRSIIECNDATGTLFDLPLGEVIGREASFAFDRASRAAIEELINNALESGAQSEIGVRMAHSVTRASVAVTPIRIQGTRRIMMRVRRWQVGPSTELDEAIARLLNQSEDSVAVTDSSGRILIGNRAFLRIVRVSTEDEVRGRYLADWVAIEDGDFAGLAARIRERAVMRRLPASVVRSDSRVAPLEVSATALTEDDQERICFTFHTTSPVAGEEPLDALLEQCSALADRLGKDSFGALSAEIEQIARGFLVRSAVARAGGDATSAASTLGITVAELEEMLRPRESSG